MGRQRISGPRGKCGRLVSSFLLIFFNFNSFSKSLSIHRFCFVIRCIRYFDEKCFVIILLFSWIALCVCAIVIVENKQKMSAHNHLILCVCVCALHSM